MSNTSAAANRIDLAAITVTVLLATHTAQIDPPLASPPQTPTYQAAGHDHGVVRQEDTVGVRAVHVVEVAVLAGVIESDHHLAVPSPQGQIPSGEMRGTGHQGVIQDMRIDLRDHHLGVVDHPLV